MRQAKVAAITEARLIFSPWPPCRAPDERLRSVDPRSYRRIVR
jgi:hypothetical protein